MTPRAPSQARPPPFAVACLIALALLTVQALGLVHRVAHGPARVAVFPLERQVHGHALRTDSPVARSQVAAGTRSDGDAEAGADHGSVDTPTSDGGAGGADIVAPDRAAVVADASPDAGSPGGDATHDCAAFDHATVADAAPWPAVPTTNGGSPPRAIAARADAPRLAAQAAGYLARGPPAA